MIFSLFYDLILLLIGLVALPKLLWQCFRLGKYRSSFKARFGLGLPPIENVDIWIHTISVGETRAALPLFKELKKNYPQAKIIISNITETGHAEAKRSMKDADAHFFLPLDFSFIIKKAIKKFRPKLLILVESDFWYNLLKSTKKSGAKIALVNGKISERSFKRFMLLPFFRHPLFSLIDCFCLQSETYAERFLKMGIPQEKIHVTGNMKFDIPVKKLTLEEISTWKADLGITPEDRVIVIGSTHDPEEEWLLAALKEIPKLKIILVPRHPERFSKIRTMSDLAYSERAHKTGKERVILIDAMGHLNSLYQLADIAIVAGSFVTHIGGHNVFEPANFGIPVLFGPHMFTQTDLTTAVLTCGAGLQVTLETLPSTVKDLLSDPQKRQAMHLAGLKLADSSRGSSHKTFETIKTLVNK